jgi:hypothetical protein
MILLLTLLACSVNKKQTNTPEKGFEQSNSDQKAIEIADKVMQAIGGQKNWDETRFIIWDFFGARKLFWDKWTGNVRIESERDNYIVLVNINDLTGKVKKNGKILTEPDSLKKYLEIGKSMWINDSYWLVMPFKLKDPGVTLKYLRQDTTSEGKMADIIELTFDSVGETPQNKYEVYVDRKTNLVTEWAYFVNANNEKSKFKNVWKQYKKYGNILLSFDRGKGYFLNDIEVLEEMPLEVFTEF